MDRFTFLLMVVANSVIVQSYSHTRRISKVNLHFRYHELFQSQVLVYTISGQLLPRDQLGDAYILSGNVTDSATLSISTITCKKTLNPLFKTCLDGNQRLTVILPDLLSGAVRVDGSFQGLLSQFRKFLIQREHKPPRPATLICTVQYEYDHSRDLGGLHMNKTGLFGIIFLSTCIIITLVVCTGWGVLSYYRHITYRRMKNKLQKALECSVQQILDKSPIITFDSKNRQNPNLDEETVCAVCLETFKDDEKLRRLECSHYYHTICIDPWLLAHQNCPLCNRNILTNAVPSVSADVTARDNGQVDSYSLFDFAHS